MNSVVEIRAYSSIICVGLQEHIRTRDVSLLFCSFFPSQPSHSMVFSSGPALYRQFQHSFCNILYLPLESVRSSCLDKLSSLCDCLAERYTNLVSLNIELFRRVHPPENRIQGELILYIREVQDSDGPTSSPNDHFLSPASNVSVKTTGMWEPAHPPPGTVQRKAVYPTFAVIQIKGNTAFICVQHDLCQSTTW
jgi:hypothetical protein